MRKVLFADAKQAVKLAEVLDLVGWKSQVEERTSSRGKCPVHVSGSTVSRSFVVTGEVWYCWTCKVGGSWIDLLVRLHGLTTREAVVWAFARLGRVVPRGDSMRRRPRRPRERP